MSDSDPERSPTELESYAIGSYRYLRLAIVVVLLTLLCAVLLERAHTSCWEESISAYYYTPVHSIFVGALVALGVCLIAIRGSTDIEDMLLNVAGVLAPIVAFVPTSQPQNLCTRHPYMAGDTLAYINNNLSAFGVGVVLAFLVAAVTILRVPKNRQRTAARNRHAVLGLVITGLLLAGGIVWYLVGQSSFLDHAHGGGAGVLFLLVGIVVFINGLSSPHQRYRAGYRVIAGAMLLSFVVVLIAGFVDSDWRHQILWLEVLELSLLLVYWTMQTAELWSPGVPIGSQRVDRETAARTSRPGRMAASVARLGRAN